LVSEAKEPRSVPTAVVSLSRVMNVVSIVALGLMMLLTVSDVFLRFAFRHPILDSPQLTEYLMVCVAAFGLAWCAANKRHVKVDLVVSHFSPRVQVIYDIITYFLGLGVCLIITWRVFLESLVLHRYHTSTTVLEVPAYPFCLVLTFGFGILCLVMLTHLIQYLYKVVKG